MEDRRCTVSLVHCHYRLPGGEDAVFAAERRLLEAHGHRVIVYERNNETPGLAAKLAAPFRAVFSLKTCRDLRALLRRERVDIVHVHNTLFAVSPAVFWARAPRPGSRQCRRCTTSACSARPACFCAAGRCARTARCAAAGCSTPCAMPVTAAAARRARSAPLSMRFHRLLGTYRHVSLIALTGFDRDKLLAFNARRPGV